MVLENEFLYLIGGRNSILEKSKKCVVLNLKTLKFSELPDLNTKRCGCGAFVGPDKFLYVFGGNLKSKNKVERLDLKNIDKNWEIIDFKNSNCLTGKTYISYR